MKLPLSIICDELAHKRPDLLPEPLLRYKRPRTSRTVQLTPPRLAMRGVRMPDGPIDAESLSSDLLYVATGDRIADASHLHANLLCIGAPIGRPAIAGSHRIVELANDADPRDVLETVLAIFEEYDEWNSAFAHTIMDRAPLDEMLGIGCSLFRNPISLASPSLENLALAGAKLPRRIQGSIWETILDKGYSPLEAIKKEELDQLIAEIENWNSPRLSKPQQAYSDNCFLITPVNDGSRYPPSLASSDICEPFTDGQVDLIALVAKGIESYLQLTDATGHVFTELALIAEMLFKGSHVDARRTSHALKQHRWHANDDYVVACMLDSETALIDAIGTRAASGAPETLVVRLDEQLAVIVNCTQSDGTASLNALDRMLMDMGLRGGASYTINGFSNISRALEQAKIAARTASSHASPGILRFDRNYMDCIVHLLGQQTDRLSLVHPAVLALDELDKGAVLIDTLTCFLRHDGNVLRTAQKLFVHRSTLAYRLNRIESVTGLSLKELSEDEASALFVSCLIVHE